MKHISKLVYVLVPLVVLLLIGLPIAVWALWKFAATRGEEFSAFLRGFRAMKAGYKSKALAYGVLIGQKK
jgi:hypothetical protein